MEQIVCLCWIVGLLVSYFSATHYLITPIHDVYALSSLCIMICAYLVSFIVLGPQNLFRLTKEPRIAKVNNENILFSLVFCINK